MVSLEAHNGHTQSRQLAKIRNLVFGNALGRRIGLSLLCLCHPEVLWLVMYSQVTIVTASSSLTVSRPPVTVLPIRPLQSLAGLGFSLCNIGLSIKELVL